MSAHTDTLLVSPWHEYKIYELDKNDLTVKRHFSTQTDIYPWETMGIYHDDNKGYIYVSNEINPALFKYDYATGKLSGRIIIDNIKYGGSIWSLTTSKTTGRLYVITYMAGQDLVEIDPDKFEITRTLDLNIYGLLSLAASTMIIDDDNGLLYIQHGGRNSLYEIDLETFKIMRTLEGEVHSRGMILDKKRNVIYINSFFYGKVIALDISSGRQSWELKIGGKPYGITLHEDSLYTNTRAGIIKIDLDTVWRDHRSGKI
ncbi:YncE family protein [Elusimicrobiota bacterium]